MRTLFSITGLLVVIGIAIWWMMQGFSRDVGLITPEESASGSVQIKTPIDDAKEVRELIETRSRQSVE